jgi:arylsulfatase A-like enzyme
MSLTRRSLLRRGGATAAGAGVLGALSAAAPASAQLGDDRERNVLLVVLPLVRADHVDAFEGGAPAKTPNLNELTKKSLRFDRALPESMAALSARRALVTGMRAFPFRDWRRLEGFPSVPGFNPVWDHQPLLMEVTRAAGVETIYVTDNPVFDGPRFADVRRAGSSVSADIGVGIDVELIPSFQRLTGETRRTMQLGVRALREVKNARSSSAWTRSTPRTRTPRPRSTCAPAGWRTTASVPPTAAWWS